MRCLHLFWLLLPTSALSQVVDCEAVRTGRFECTHEGGTSIIERTATEQHEREVGGSWEERLHVEWIGPCTYRLRPMARPLDDKAMLAAGIVPECTIQEVNEFGFSVLTTWKGGPPEGVLLHYKRLR